MSSEYDFILENIKYSFSSVNSFTQCKYGFKLNYIDVVDKENNAFAQFGTLIHTVLEKYFSEELDIWDLADYYKKQYEEMVNLPYPPNAYVNLAQSYYLAGLAFFEDFAFPREDYEILAIESTINFALGNLKVTARPDLILKEKKTGKIILFDYKTAKLKTVKAKKAQQLADYLAQLFLYCHALWLDEGIMVDEVRIWFIRDNHIYQESCNSMAITESIMAFEEKIDAIKQEEEWAPSNTKANEFFCYYICGVRGSCKYIKNGSII